MMLKSCPALVIKIEEVNPPHTNPNLSVNEEKQEERLRIGEFFYGVMENTNNSNFSIDYNNIENTYHVLRDYIYFKGGLTNVVHLVIICIGLPLNLVSIFLVFKLVSKVKKGNCAPVYVVNLLISDLIQLCSSIALMAHEHNVPFFSYMIGLMASVGFMVCLSLERYMIIAKPMWYTFQRDIRGAFTVCAVVWILPFVFLTTFYIQVDSGIKKIIFSSFLLLPFPSFIFFTVGTIKSLSAAHGYILLFLPVIIYILLDINEQQHPSFTSLAFICVYISPLADTAMYVLLRESVIDKVLASLCCCEMSNKQEMTNLQLIHRHQEMDLRTWSPVLQHLRVTTSDFKIWSPESHAHFLMNSVVPGQSLMAVSVPLPLLLQNLSALQHKAASTPWILTWRS
ncbi:C3a anaphylatoxin chemotactic receptor-like [Xiphophorus maculatus]|uniref:C3a anaphylatoxin chemotactic receptor-like n=1 Tax=Xiphophorus maculatus TaxID=8083 RepID=UPI000C6CE199|nr:C3a anaphylatoxin chemotactic receptor-like [Xiphophorus maculatus]